MEKLVHTIMDVRQLETGKIIVQGPADDLLANKDVQRAYLGREKPD